MRAGSGIARDLLDAQRTLRTGSARARCVGLTGPDPMTWHKVSADKQRGFVLALTLWILAAITIAAAIFSDRVSQAVELAQKQQQNTDALLDIAATRAEILFRIGVTPISAYGL